MTTAKKIGIWMDHATAHLMEFTTDVMETKTIGSDFTHEDKEEAGSKGEHLEHNKEQHKQAAYYKKLGEVIRNYDEVILFGPTDAKFELFNILKRDHHFEKIAIEVQPTDKMTEHQQHAYVREHFQKN